MVDTTTVTERRELRFSSMKDILDDVDYLDSGDPPRSVGNWTSGQIVEHVARLIDYSIDGFPARASLPIRVLGRLMRSKILINPLRAGLKFPAKFSFLEPNRAVTWEAAVEHLHGAIGRLESQRMRARSPVLGRLTHKQWEAFHCRHAELHFSFLHPA